MIKDQLIIFALLKKGIQFEKSLSSVEKKKSVVSNNI